jgi:hypothetical protein
MSYKALESFSLSKIGDLGEVMDLYPLIAPELNELIEFVRANSPYYHDLWRNVSEDGMVLLNAYPPFALESYCAVNTSFGSQVLTGPHVSGIVQNTGGKSLLIDREDNLDEIW